MLLFFVPRFMQLTCARVVVVVVVVVMVVVMCVCWEGVEGLREKNIYSNKQ